MRVNTPPSGSMSFPYPLKSTAGSRLPSRSTSEDGAAPALPRGSRRSQPSSSQEEAPTPCRDPGHLTPSDSAPALQAPPPPAPTEGKWSGCGPRVHVGLGLCEPPLQVLANQKVRAHVGCDPGCSLLSLGPGCQSRSSRPRFNPGVPGSWGDLRGLGEKPDYLGHAGGVSKWRRLRPSLLIRV